VILDFDGKPLHGRVKRRPFGDGPGSENAVKLEAQIEMQACGIVFLDNVTGAFRCLD
jgi:hypothetical protein